MAPDLEHNADATNAESENLYIVGDNLDALKHLLGSYAGQVKCIYIDPPYNTAPRPRLRRRDPRVHHPIPYRGWSSTNYRDHRCGQYPDGGGVDPGRLQAWSRCASTWSRPRCTDRRRRHPPAGEDYSSQTPLIIRFGEEFAACPVKCSMPLTGDQQAKNLELAVG